MNRRTFIAGAGALAALEITAAAENSKIGVGMLGTGHSHFAGKLKALQESPNYEVIAAVDTVDARKKFPALNYVSQDELLHNPKIQMVVVECRAWEAVPWGSKVIAAGKHLHLEKPPGNSYGAFKELIDEARRKKLLLQTGYVWRWHQGVTAAVEAAQKGWLGDVFMVRGTMSSDRDTEERNIEAHYKGGGMFELGGHVIDRVVELLGRPKSVKAWLHHDTSVSDKLADNNLAVLEYDKSLAVITQAAKSFASGPQRSFEILGTDGNILVFPEANPSTMHVWMRKPQGAYKAGAQVINLPPQPRFVGDFADMARALQTGTPLKYSYDHELLLQETLLRASGEMA
jgi:predicted dehydrogenase